MRKLVLLSALLFVFLCAAAPFQEPVQASCETAYGLSPSETLPKWLQSSVPIMDLHTENRYDLLTGHLLKTGLVDGSTCPSRGLNADGSPNACGLEVTQKEIVAWQNRYDPAILTAAQTYHLPPYLMKAVVAVESQFWPAPDWTRGEIGLGQMTEFGADLLLSYRPEVYLQVCRQALSQDTCNTAYVFQPYSNQAMLRGLVLKSLDATCSTCSGGIDPSKGERAVETLAETLSASCTQSARTIAMATGHTPSALMNYEDFWRFSLANYHSGAGCMYQALRRSANPTSWSSIASGLPPGCLSGSVYIRRIEEAIKP